MNAHPLLLIRREQLAAFSQPHKEKFEEWMLVHMRKHFPRQCVSASDEQLREIVRHGMERAAAYGLVGQRDVCKYIDLLVVFGRNLDKDPRYPWAGAILRTAGKPGAKVWFLQKAAAKQLRGA